MKKQLFVGRILCSTFILSSLIYVGILIVARLPEVNLGIFAHDDPIITLVTQVLGCVSIITLVAGIYIPRWLIKREPREGLTLVAGVTRWSFFQSVAIFGLILGILGARWAIVSLFIIVSICANILSFPTEERWGKTTNEQHL